MNTLRSYFRETGQHLLEKFSEETLQIQPLYYIFNEELLPEYHVILDHHEFSEDDINRFTDEGKKKIGILTDGSPAIAITVRFHRVELVFETPDILVYYDLSREVYIELDKDPDVYMPFNTIRHVRGKPDKIYDILFYMTKYQTAIARYLEHQGVLDPADNHVLRVSANIYHHYGELFPKEYSTDQYSFHLVTKCDDQIDRAEIEHLLELDNQEKIMALLRLTGVDKLYVLRNDKHQRADDIIRGFGKEEPNYFFDGEIELSRFFNMEKDRLYLEYGLY